MKVLKLKAFQETACYKKPFANKVTETYPLPPYSTVKGMVHAILDAKELVPFSLSIQGDYESMIIDYKKTYFVKNNTVNMPIILDGLAVDLPEFPDMTSMPLYTHMLFNIDLLIHIRAEEEILQKIFLAFQNLNSHVSLGRQEDLVRIDSIEMVDLRELDLFEDKHLDYSMYIPLSIIQEDEVSTGIPYLLNWTYEIKNGIREWDRIPTLYYTKGQLVNDDLLEGTAYLDKEGHLVIWNK